MSITEKRNLESSNFNIYPHYVFATAFLVNGELADYKIQNRERDWGDRTFRGSNWENEVWKHGFIAKDWTLTCEYKRILVHNDNEHNKAFEELEDWIFNNFKTYKKANLVRWHNIKDIPTQNKQAIEILDKVTNYIKSNMEKAKEQIKYYEQRYSQAKQEENKFYIKSFYRQINRQQSRYETLREIMSIIEESEAISNDKGTSNNIKNS